MSLELPPTLIVVHNREKRRKCTVEKLRGEEGFFFWRYPRRGEESLSGYIRLGLGGPPLGPDDSVRGLVILDGTWRWAKKMEAQYADVPVRGLANWVTAYPRVSELFEDPAAGLATIEAVYAAYVQMGRDTTGLLNGYHWGREFEEKNRELIEHFRRG